MAKFDIDIHCENVSQPVPVLIILKDPNTDIERDSYAMLLTGKNLHIGNIDAQGNEELTLNCADKDIQVFAELKRVPFLKLVWRAIKQLFEINTKSQPVPTLKCPKISIGNKVISPKISIIVPNRDNLPILRQCIDSLVMSSDYENLELIIVDNNSKDTNLFRYYAELKANQGVQIIEFNEKFNFSRINNYGAKHATGEILLFANNDLEALDANCLQKLANNFANKERKIIGAKLLYPDNTIQHAGIVLGMGGLTGHLGRGLPDELNDEFGLLNTKREVSAITGAFMGLYKSDFVKIGGFDESYVVEFSDIDLCLRAKREGISIVYDPQIKLYHYEGTSRGQSKGSMPEIISDRKLFFTKWAAELSIDPHFPPNLSRIDENFLSVPSGL